jgi:RNA polymerase sigma factor (sigma-70 family)
MAMTAAEPSRGAQAPERTSQAFERLAEPFRREIKLHCYRMLGSLHEAEDLVQETWLRAWRSFDGFEAERPGSFRAWLYRIATKACLNAIDSRKHVQRLLPDQLGPATAQMPDGAPATEVAWLEPYPDSDLEGIADDAPNPEMRYASREAVQLAFVAAIQQLPPRQRAALMLCDVLGWASTEAATLLGGTTASINSALQRARETLNAIPTAGRWRRPGRMPPSNSSSAAICRLGKGTIWTASSPSSRRTRRSPCRRGCNGTREGRLSGLSLRWRGRPAAAFAWCRRRPTGSRLLLSITAPARTRRGPRTPSTCLRLSTT